MQEYDNFGLLKIGTIWVQIENCTQFVQIEYNSQIVLKLYNLSTNCQIVLRLFFTINACIQPKNLLFFVFMCFWIKFKKYKTNWTNNLKKVQK